MIREWQGLGYNRRAVNLHRAARHVAAHGWPDDLTELPGVGATRRPRCATSRSASPCCPWTRTCAAYRSAPAREFGPERAQALFDLGATVCLARVPRCGVCPLAAGCPSRGRRYEPLRKQSRFEGSFRQRRAEALRAVADAPRPLAELDAEAVAALERDGLVRCERGLVVLPG